MAGSKAAAPDRRITRAGAKLFNGARVTKPGLIHKRKTSELDAITEAVLPEARAKSTSVEPATPPETPTRKPNTYVVQTMRQDADGFLREVITVEVSEEEAYAITPDSINGRMKTPEPNIDLRRSPSGFEFRAYTPLEIERARLASAHAGRHDILLEDLEFARLFSSPRR